MEVTDSDLFPVLLPRDLVASVFVNRQHYLVLANYRHNPLEVEATDAYIPVQEPSGARKRRNLPPRSLAILRREAA